MRRKRNTAISIAVLPLIMVVNEQCHGGPWRIIQASHYLPLSFCCALVFNVRPLGYAQRPAAAEWDVHGESWRKLNQSSRERDKMGFPHQPIKSHPSLTGQPHNKRSFIVTLCCERGYFSLFSISPAQSSCNRARRALVGWVLWNRWHSTWVTQYIGREGRPCFTAALPHQKLPVSPIVNWGGWLFWSVVRSHPVLWMCGGLRGVKEIAKMRASLWGCDIIVGCCVLCLACSLPCPPPTIPRPPGPSLVWRGVEFHTRFGHYGVIHPSQALLYYMALCAVTWTPRHLEFIPPTLHQTWLVSSNQLVEDD